MADPLTDEELTAIEADASGPCYECNVNMWSPRIFAALRASRQREAVLIADRDSWKRMYDIAKERADKAEEAWKSMPKA